MSHQHNTASNHGSVELSQRRILIDGAPRLVLAGEIHYFRLDPSLWENRILLLKEAGMDTVATYIPWVWHQVNRFHADLDGSTHPQRNLRGFIELCKKHQMNLIVRPGPFCMAELRNEGVPDKEYEFDDNQPVTWDGAAFKTRALDYGDKEFIVSISMWYREVAEEIRYSLKSHGGPIIAVQLDNEIGMLQWVSNCPDLGFDACYRFRDYMLQRYSELEASRRVGANIRDLKAVIAALRSPRGDALELHHDLGLYMRERFAKYVNELYEAMRAFHIDGVPFLINVHGSGGGRGTSFPIGISQLLSTYKNRANFTSGSDHYLGDLTVTNVADLYLMNAFMLSTHSSDQPLTSLEFEVGNGNYGDDLGNLYSPESAELKARLCVAQGNKLLNYYLFCGGENPLMNSNSDNSRYRIAFTGQRHGFAAPVNPEGKLDPSFAALARLNHSLRSIEHLLADSHQEFDNVAIGFIPDHYLTEYCYPKSEARRAQIEDLQRFRGQGMRDLMGRCLVLNGLSFPAINLQDEGKLSTEKTIVVATGKTMSREVQEHLCEFLSQGGRLLLAGLLPDRDHSGAPCTLLADALGLKSVNVVYDQPVGANEHYWPSVKGHEWAAGRAEVRVTAAQLLASADGQPLTPLLTEIESGLPCAVQVQLVKGKAIFLGCDYPAHLDFYRELLTVLQVVPNFKLEADGPGVVVTPTIARGGRRLLHVINVAPQSVSFTLTGFGKRVLNGKRFVIPAKTGWALPFGMGDYWLPEHQVAGSVADKAGVDVFAERRLQDVVICESSAEIIEERSNKLVLRCTQASDLVLFKTRKTVKCRDAEITRRGELVWLRVKKNVGAKFTVTFA